METPKTKARPLTLEDFIDKLNSLREEDIDLDSCSSRKESKKRLDKVREITQDLAYFLETPDLDINAKSKKPEHRGATLLHAMSRLDIPDADSYEDGEDGENRTLAEILLQDKDINVNALDNDGNTPLMVAVKNGACFSCEKIMEDARTDIFIQNNSGLNFASYAALYGADPAASFNALESAILLISNPKDAQALCKETIEQIAIEMSKNASINITEEALNLLERTSVIPTTIPTRKITVIASTISNPPSATMEDAHEMVNDEEFDQAFLRTLPSSAAYIGTGITSTAISTPEHIRKSLAEAMSDPSKQKIVIGLNLRGHFTGFVLDKGSEATPPQISYVDPAPYKKFSELHRAPGNLIAAISEAMPGVTIKRSASELQPMIYLPVATLANNKCALLTHFSLCGLVFDKAKIADDGTLELADYEGATHRIDKLNNYWSLALAKANSRHFKTDYSCSEDMAKLLIYEGALNSFIDDKKQHLQNMQEATAAAKPSSLKRERDYELSTFTNSALLACGGDNSTNYEEQSVTNLLKEYEFDFPSPDSDDKETPGTSVANAKKQKPGEVDLECHESFARL